MMWIIEKIKNLIKPQSEPVEIEYLLVDKLPERGEQWAIYICGTEWYFFRNDNWVRADFDDDESLVWKHDFNVGGDVTSAIISRFCPECGAYMESER